MPRLDGCISVLSIDFDTDVPFVRGPPLYRPSKIGLLSLARRIYSLLLYTVAILFLVRYPTSFFVLFFFLFLFFSCNRSAWRVWTGQAYDSAVLSCTLSLFLIDLLLMKGSASGLFARHQFRGSSRSMVIEIAFRGLYDSSYSSCSTASSTMITVMQGI